MRRPVHTRHNFQAATCMRYLPTQRCQVNRYRRETPVFRRSLQPPVRQDLSPVFTSYLRNIRWWPPHARWWSRCLAVRPPSAPLFTYLRSSRANLRCARRCTIVDMTKSRDKSGQKLRNICKSTKMTTVNSTVVLLSHPPIFSLILELCLPFLKLCRLASLLMLVISQLQLRSCTCLCRVNSSNRLSTVITLRTHVLAVDICLQLLLSFGHVFDEKMHSLIPSVQCFGRI